MKQVIQQRLVMNLPWVVQVFKAKGLRHPSAGLHLSVGATFIPNDIQLGGAEAPFIILTGPNMGGMALARLLLSVLSGTPGPSRSLCSRASGRAATFAIFCHSCYFLLPHLLCEHAMLEPGDVMCLRLGCQLDTKLFLFFQPCKHAPCLIGTYFLYRLGWPVRRHFMKRLLSLCRGPMTMA